MYISHSHTFTYGWQYFSFKNVVSSMFWNIIIWLISSMWYFSSSMLSTSSIFWFSFTKFNFIHVIDFMNVIHIIWLICMSSISTSCSLWSLSLWKFKLIHVIYFIHMVDPCCHISHLIHEHNSIYLSSSFQMTTHMCGKHQTCKMQLIWISIHKKKFHYYDTSHPSMEIIYLWSIPFMNEFSCIPYILF